MEHALIAREGSSGGKICFFFDEKLWMMFNVHRERDAAEPDSLTAIHGAFLDSFVVDESSVAALQVGNV